MSSVLIFFTTRISKATRLSRRHRRLIFAKTRRFSVGMSQWRVSLPCLNCAYDGKETQMNPPRKNRKSAFWHFLLFWQSPPLFHNFHHQWRDDLQTKENKKRKSNRFLHHPGTTKIFWHSLGPLSLFSTTPILH